MIDYQGKHRREDRAHDDDRGLGLRWRIWMQRMLAEPVPTPGDMLPDPPAHRTDPRGE